MLPSSSVVCDASSPFHHRPLSAPAGPSADPGRRQGKGLKKDVLGTCSGRCNRKACQITMSQKMNAWKRRKQKMDKASRRSWIEYEHSLRAMQLREYTLKEFSFGADAMFRQINVQSKAVFSYAMTMMEIRGWEDEERWEPNLQHACGFTQKKL